MNDQPDVKPTAIRAGDVTAPIYNLSLEELGELEQGLIAIAEQAAAGSDFVGVWIHPDSKFANFARTHEASYFPEVAEVSPQTEASTRFLVLVDTRPENRRVVHAATVTGLEQAEDGAETTGFNVVDELIAAGNFTADEFRQFYRQRKLELSKSIAVETNFRIGEKVVGPDGIPTSYLVYLALFSLVKQGGAAIDQAAVFATLNDLQVNSFERFGLDFEPMMGRTDLSTPEAELGRTSLPVAIIYNAKAEALFGALPIELPVLMI
ncbi:hypothetical protein HY346_01640 [Candidatus Microgenomates bacterium]|nr:hypothetical protein [Candidatus Microgenomates bacterium]